MALPGICPECGVSRIPPFLNCCSRCCNTVIKRVEQARICELNKAFYGDEPRKENCMEAFSRIFQFIIFPIIGLIVAIVAAVAGAGFVIAKYAAGGGLLYWLLN
jgi:hypothetical protein